MKLWDFLQIYRSDIIFIASTIFIILRSVFSNELDFLKSEIFSLVTEAEKIYGEKTGQIKLNFVVRKIHKKMPLVLKTFLTEKKLEKIIESVLIVARESWKKISSGGD